MKITKYDHACLVIEKDSTKLIIDPGSFTTLPKDIDSVDFVIITEEHYDHFNLENLQQITAKNPNLQVFTTQAVHDELIELGTDVHVVSGESKVTMGDFEVSFFETDHAVVYKKSPCKSLPLKINDYLYYPSDTYRTISEKVKVLALPTSGPWYKVSESIEFANAINSEIVLVTHNALNSQVGNKVTNNFLKSNIDENRQFVFLESGESLEI